MLGDPAPDFALKSLDGPNLRLSEFRGRVVLLGFWASWCGDCRAQMRRLGGLAERYAGAGFDLLAVNLDTDTGQARDAVDALDLGFPVLHDVGGTVSAAYDVSSMPYVLVIDRDGVVRAEFDGYRRGDEEAYLEQVGRLLEE